MYLFIQHSPGASLRMCVCASWPYSGIYGNTQHVISPFGTCGWAAQRERRNRWWRAGMEEVTDFRLFIHNKTCFTVERGLVTESFVCPEHLVWPQPLMQGIQLPHMIEELSQAWCNRIQGTKPFWASSRYNHHLHITVRWWVQQPYMTVWGKMPLL